MVMGRIGVDGNGCFFHGLADGEQGGASIGTASSTIASDGICGGTIGAYGYAVSAVASVPQIIVSPIGLE